METFEIPISKGQWLSDALAKSKYKYTKIPSNVVLNKTLTGIGATHIEIESKRNSIIIEPNVPVIKGKVAKHPQCLGIYKACTESKIKKYLLNKDIEYKKIITTPESFSRITNAVAELNVELDEEQQIDLFKDYFCLFDECEKISQDYDFRESIAFPINDFFKFENKAFVSATPLKQAHKEFDLQGFNILTVTPDYDYSVKLELIATDKFLDAFCKKINKLRFDKSECICIFYNSTKGITDLLTQFPYLAEECAVFCSDTSKNKLNVKNIITFTDFNPLYIKRINFFTSRFYSAVDIVLPLCPDVIMITDLSTAKHSTIDPLSEAIQIQGRFRNEHSNGKRFNSLCHITNFMNFNVLTYDESVKELNLWFETAQHLQEKYKKNTDTKDRQSIEKEFKSCNIFPYLETPNLESAFKRNTFSIINRYNNERVKGYYTGEKLRDAYQNDTNYFELTYIDDIDRTFNFNFSSDRAKHFCNTKTPQKTIIQDIIEQLDKGLDPQTILSSLKDVATAERYDDIETVTKAYKLLGSSKLKNTFKAIKKDYKTAELFQLSEQKRYSQSVVREILEEFEPDFNIKIYKTLIMSRLQKIFDKYSLVNKTGEGLKVTQKSIFDYFDGKSNNESRTYTLIEILPNLYVN